MRSSSGRLRASSATQASDATAGRARNADIYRVSRGITLQKLLVVEIQLWLLYHANDSIKMLQSSPAGYIFHRYHPFPLQNSFFPRFATSPTLYLSLYYVWAGGNVFIRRISIFANIFKSVEVIVVRNLRVSLPFLSRGILRYYCHVIEVRAMGCRRIDISQLIKFRDAEGSKSRIIAIV